VNMSLICGNAMVPLPFGSIHYNFHSDSETANPGLAARDAQSAEISSSAGKSGARTVSRYTRTAVLEQKQNSARVSSPISYPATTLNFCQTRE
jgi:hypothetical protein